MPKRKFRLLIITQDSSAFGGAEVLINSLSKIFIKKKIAVYCISGYKPFNQAQRRVGVKDIFVPFRLDVIGGFRGLVKFIAQVPYGLYWYHQKYKEIVPDVVLISGFSEKIVASLVAYLIHIPVVWLEHAPLFSVFKRNFGFPRFLYKSVATTPKIIIVPSLYTKNYICKEIGVKSGVVKVIHNGVFRKKLSIIKKRSLGLSKSLNPINLLMISRIQKEKGQDTAIEAMPILKKEGIMVNLILVGDGDYKKYLLTLARNLKVARQVKFTGYITEKQKFDFLRKCDFYLFLTRWNMEGFGIAPLEAMSMGVPVIASNFGPVPEVVGDAALLVKPNSVEVAKAVMKLINNQPLRNELAEKGRSRVARYFDIEKCAQKYLDIFQSL